VARKSEVTSSPQLLLTLNCYAWPGNVRELETLCQRVQAAQPMSLYVEPHILSYDPVEDDYLGFPELPRNGMLATIRTMLSLYALRRHLGLEPTKFRREETNLTLRLLLEIEDEHAGYHPNLSFDRITKYWESPALYDLCNFDSADPNPTPEYGSLSLPSVFNLLRNYCCQSTAGPGAALELLLECQGPENQPDIQHWEFTVAGQYMDPLINDDLLQTIWGAILPPTEEQKRCAETVRQFAKENASNQAILPLRSESRPPVTNQPVEHVIGRPPLEPLRVNIKEVAKLLGKSERTLAEWQRLRIIPSEKIGRNVMFDIAAVDLALKKFRRNAAGD